MTTPDPAEIEQRLNAFLTSRLGTWPPAGSLELRACDLRDQPSWNGQLQPFYGIESPVGTVLTFSETVFPLGRTLNPLAIEDELGMSDAYLTIPRMFGHPDMHFGRAVFRFLGSFPDLPEYGEWCQTDDPRLPEWLQPFNGGILVLFLDGTTYAAGVGLKKHNDLGYEIAVGTDPAYRGRGLAQALVAQAARHVWELGAIPVYQHGTHNAASARVADKAGFPDRGWHSIGMG